MPAAKYLAGESAHSMPNVHSHISVPWTEVVGSQETCGGYLAVCADHDLGVQVHYWHIKKKPIPDGVPFAEPPIICEDGLRLPKTYSFASDDQI